MLMLSSAAYAQGAFELTGRVNGDNGPLAGVSVVVKSSGRGTTTNQSGGYKLSGVTPDDAIVFSFMGYEPQEIVVGQNKILNVTLEEHIAAIDDVVVIGYGVQRKSHLTGSISKIEGNSLVDMPLSDVTQALQGQMAGLSIDNTTSEVGVAPEVRVRGIGSVSASTQPLVVIDGYPVPGGLQMINSSDIQSIEILKDASSAAIYGSRAANGVIMITTKSGSQAEPKYAVKIYSGIKYPYKLFDIMTTTEQVALMTHEASLGGKAPGGTEKFSAWLESQIGATDWQREALRDVTHITNVQFSVSGGRKEVRYYVSGNYIDDQGLMLNNEVKKLNIRSKVDMELSKRVSLGINISGTYQASERPNESFRDFYRTTPALPVMHNDFTTALTGYTGYARGNHFLNVYYPNFVEPGDPESGDWDFDNPTWGNATLSSSSTNNVRSRLETSRRDGESFQSVGNAYLRIKLIDGMIFQSQNGYNYKNGMDRSYANFGSSEDNSPSTGTYSSSLYVDLLSENTVTYDKAVGAHTFTGLLGFTAQKTRRERALLSGSQFPTDKIHTLNAATVFEQYSNSGALRTGTWRDPDETLVSYLGRLNYSFQEKYLASAAVRLDQSSLFAKNNRNAYFPSVSVGWRVSEEKFMKDMKWMDALKLRASWGVTGNNKISYNASRNVYSTSNYVFGEGSGSLVAGMANTSSTLGNPNLTWEQTREWNYGMDISILKGRISLDADYYHSVTKALLFKQPVQSFTGFQDGWNNIGRVRNLGVELSLNTRNIRKKDFDWSTRLVFSLNRNKALELGGEYQIINYGENQEQYLARVGSPVVQFYGYKVVGIWDTVEQVEQNPSLAGDAPGKLMFQNTNGDDAITPEDMVVLGTPYPDFTYGMTNSFRYKKFDLTIIIQGVQGVQMFCRDGNYAESWKRIRNYTNNRWISPEHRGDGMTSYTDDARAVFSDYFIENGSYACLRNAVLGYTLDKKASQKVGMKGLRIYASGSNLFYIWSKNYRGINPEARKTSGDYSNPLVTGYQVGGFPITSTVTLGLDISF